VGASTGTVDSTTALDRCDDARAALAYLRRRPEIDTARIAILGIGDGATIAALIADTDPEVRAPVLLAPPPNLLQPSSASRLVVTGDATAVADPAAAVTLVRAARGRIAEWTATTLGGPALGPKPHVVAVRRHRRR
jgi:dienelactone hydrolase